MYRHYCSGQPCDASEYYNYNDPICHWCGAVKAEEKQQHLIYELKDLLGHIVEANISQYLTKDCMITDFQRTAAKALEEIEESKY